MLKSDQNGIEIYKHLYGFQCHDELKSDQNGIEIKASFDLPSITNMLKSDQNGIEIQQSINDMTNRLKVKIRPKWD